MVANLTYDFQGNLASKGPSGAVQNYTFDLGNRLRSVPNKETGYEYDGHGRRVYANTVGSGHILSQYAIDGKLLYQENHKLGKRIDYIYLGTRLVAQRLSNRPPFGKPSVSGVNPPGVTASGRGSGSLPPVTAGCRPAGCRG